MTLWLRIPYLIAPVVVGLSVVMILSIFVPVYTMRKRNNKIHREIRDELLAFLAQQNAEIYGPVNLQLMLKDYDTENGFGRFMTNQNKRAYLHTTTPMIEIFDTRGLAYSGGFHDNNNAGSAFAYQQQPQVMIPQQSQVYVPQQGTQFLYQPNVSAATATTYTPASASATATAASTYGGVEPASVTSYYQPNMPYYTIGGSNTQQQQQQPAQQQQQQQQTSSVIYQQQPQQSTYPSLHQKL